MKCLNCGYENDITDTRCRFCGYELNREQIMKTEEIINKANEFASKVNDVSDSSSVGKIRKFIQYIPLCIISVVAIIFPAIIALGVVIIYLVVLKINSNIRKSKESQVNNKLLSK